MCYRLNLKTLEHWRKVADDLLATGEQGAVAGRTGWFVQPFHRASSECKVRICSFEFNQRGLAGSVAVNMAAGFVAALTVRYLLVRRQGGATDGER